MKGLLAKLKGLPIKSILIAQGEKFVLGAVGLLVLLALISTTWGGYQKQPEELLTKATAAGTALHTGGWPEEKQAAFKPSTYQMTAQSMFEELNQVDAPSPFSYDKPMSFPIYAREEPRGEPEWPSVQDLLSDSFAMVLGVNPPELTLEEMEALGPDPLAAGGPGRPAGGANAKGGAADAKGAGARGAGLGAGAKAGSKGKKGEEMLSDTALMGPGAMGMGANSTGMEPRGQRVVAVRGIVNLFDIGRAIQKALHLETPADGMAYVEVIDFKIQRQKAVAGPNPWPDDSWQDVSLERADEVLGESGQAADLVATECIDPVFTMPLPTRLDGDYTRLVSHPSLERFELSKEQREMEQKLNNAILDEAAEKGVDEQVGKRRGFMQSQVDINGVRNNIMGAGGNMGDLYKRAGVTPTAATGRSTMPNLGGPRGAMGGPMGAMGGPRAGGMMMPGMPNRAGGAGMGMGMQAGVAVQQVGGAAAGYLMLFRYLDFDVNPGEAYRYRVQLEFANPNYGEPLDKVKEASVSEGESRLTEWSQPSAPVVVKPDSNLFLTDVDKRNRNRGEAKIHAYQWDPSLGTYIDSKLVAKFGEFLGGLTTSVRLDLGVPSYEEKQVLITTKDFLLDTAVPLTVIPADNPDLNLILNAKPAKDGLEFPAEAIVLDEYGQLRVLDSISEKLLASEVEKKVQAEREPWKYLLESAETEGAGDASAGQPAGRMGMMMPGMEGPQSALKRSKAGKAGARGADQLGMPAMTPGGAGGPGRGRGR